MCFRTLAPQEKILARLRIHLKAITIIYPGQMDTHSIHGSSPLHAPHGYMLFFHSCSKISSKKALWGYSVLYCLWPYWLEFWLILGFLNWKIHTEVSYCSCQEVKSYVDEAQTSHMKLSYFCDSRNKQKVKSNEQLNLSI